MAAIIASKSSLYRKLLLLEAVFQFFYDLLVRPPRQVQYIFKLLRKLCDYFPFLYLWNNRFLNDLITQNMRKICAWILKI